MADPYEYSHPEGKPPGNAPYDPSVEDPSMMPGCRWRIKWFDKSTREGKKLGKNFGTGKELPKLKQRSDMSGTRVLDAGEATPGRKLHVIKYKDFYK